MKAKENPFKNAAAYSYPSRFGSHSSMIVEKKDNKIVCKDEFGTYLTTPSQIDSGLADPNRFSRKEIFNALT